MSTDAIWALIVGLFWLGFLVVVLVGILAFRSHKSLKSLKKSLDESLIPLEAAINRRTTEVNKMHSLLSEQKTWEGRGPAPLSQSGTPAGILAAHRLSSSLLATLEQVVALRFPDLNVHSEFIQVGQHIEECEADIRKKAQLYNAAARIYSDARGSIPSVFYANFMRYPRAERFELDPATDLDAGRFDPAEGDVVNQFAPESDIQIAGTVRHATRYFYMFPGEVPKGPASADDLRILLAQGVLTTGAMVAEVGSEEWKPIVLIAAEWEEAAN